MNTVGDKTMATRTSLTPNERDHVLERAADLHMAVYKAAKESMDPDAAWRAADAAVDRWKVTEIKRVLAGAPDSAIPQAVQS